MPEQVLHCLGPPAHDWTRPPQRGKPPRYCPEHKVNQNNGGNLDAHQDPAPHTLNESGSGTSDSSSASVGAVKENPFITRARLKQQQEAAARQPAPRRAKLVRNDEALENTPEKLLEKLSAIREMKRQAEFAYKAAVKQTDKFPMNGDVHEIGRLFDVSDKQQKRLINVCVAEREAIAKLKRLDIEIPA